MRRLKQFEPLVIHDFEESAFHMENHSHTYFEIGYIYKGSGIHFLNHSHISYVAGDIFMISPDDAHTFRIEESTRFVFIKFTDAYFNNASADSYWTEISEVMRSHALKEKKARITGPDAVVLKNTIDSIVAFSESQHKATLSSAIFYQIYSIIKLVKASLGYMTQSTNARPAIQQRLLAYIHEYIYRPELLQIKSIAAKFNIAEGYFSAYFKRSYGTGYTEYVNNYKASVIAMRIQTKQFTLKQIADEFGFADESHLSRFFKKHHHQSPGSYQQT